VNNKKTLKINQIEIKQSALSVVDQTDLEHYQNRFAEEGMGDVHHKDIDNIFDSLDSYTKRVGRGYVTLYTINTLQEWLYIYTKLDHNFGYAEWQVTGRDEWSEVNCDKRLYEYMKIKMDELWNIRGFIIKE
jgi:hypothetical protein